MALRKLRLFGEGNSKYTDIRYSFEGEAPHLLGVVTFSIPAFHLRFKGSDKWPKGRITCPGAFLCIRGCYARTGKWRVFPATYKRAHWVFKATLRDDFEKKVALELLHYQRVGVKPASERKTGAGAVRGRKPRSFTRRPLHLVRIHDSGDFYTPEYLAKWLRIMKWAEKNVPTLRFWAYTKAVSWMKAAQQQMGDSFPKNFTVIFSEGGIEDSAIDRDMDRFARVFVNRAELQAQGYEEGSSKELGDIRACFGPNRKVGLVYHGVGIPFTTDPEAPEYPLCVASIKEYLRRKGLAKYYTGGEVNPKLSSALVAALLIPGVPPL